MGGFEGELVVARNERGGSICGDDCGHRFLAACLSAQQARSILFVLIGLFESRVSGVIPPHIPPPHTPEDGLSVKVLSNRMPVTR